MSQFKWAARVRILMNLTLGVLLLVWPHAPFEWLHEATPQPTWVVGVIGVLMIYEALAHVASAIAPGLAGSSNLFVVLGPILPIVLLVWLGLSVPSRAALLLAVYEAVFVLVLSRTLQRGWLADLATKP